LALVRVDQEHDFVMTHCGFLVDVGRRIRPGSPPAGAGGARVSPVGGASHYIANQAVGGAKAPMPLSRLSPLPQSSGSGGALGVRRERLAAAAFAGDVGVGEGELLVQARLEEVDPGP